MTGRDFSRGTKAPRTTRVGVLLALLCAPVAAPAQMTCSRQIEERDFVLTGMFQRHPGMTTEIASFPLFASADRLAYAVCPSLEDRGEERTVCRVAVLERRGQAMSPLASLDVDGCSPDAPWNPDCPDFTAEGFTAGNAGKLAKSLQRTHKGICAHFGSTPVATLKPVPGEAASPAGLDAGTVFELHAGCAALGSPAKSLCEALMRTPGSATGSVVQMRADERVIVCTVSPRGEIALCSP
ncbi:hypothetical protein [Enterovirga rhinocerotis]|uniref:Uncharacterized protein n=1 Tax=Enterovirga rhinocerotis TaxID=1339210 RepID=A0A4R7BVS3_9HYPH|nr:hypothetical protein [Enterovirga rhinocerotis]TDR89978.1 hypothetical protein EV668_2815 [Enterovirga rhinocerotis]